MGRLPESARGGQTLPSWLSYAEPQKFPKLDRSRSPYTYKVVPPSYKLVYKPHEYYSYITYKP